METSVLVAASVYIVARELKSTKVIKDPHYERSRKLTDILVKHVKQRIGVYTQTIGNQAYNVLRRVVESRLQEERCQPQNMSHILNHCGDLLERVLENLVREPIDQEAKERNQTRVGLMYSSLTQRMGLVTRQGIRSLAIDRAKGRASPGYRRFVLPDEIKRLNKQHRQLMSLRKEPPEPSDCEILAEVVALYESYMAEMLTELYVASTDSSHFSPRRFDDGTVSDQVTRQIEETFSIKCDWPEIIADLVQARTG